MTTQKDLLMTTVRKSIKDAINSGDLESRVGRLEGTMESLAEEVKQTNHNLQEFARETNNNINQLANQVGHIKDTLVEQISEVKDVFSCQINQKTKPDWGIILSVVGLITTIIVMSATLVAFIFSGQSERIANNENKLLNVEQQVSSTNYQHGQVDNWIRNTEEKINQVNINTETLRLWKIEHIEEHASFKEKDGKIESDIEYLKKSVDELKNKNTIRADSIQFVEP